MNILSKAEISSGNYIELTIQDKLAIIGISNDRIKELRNLKAKEISFDRENEHNPRVEEINVDEVVGSTRAAWDGISWIEALDKKVHKQYMFVKYKEKEFDKLLASANNGMDYPIVVKKDNEYYIHDDGLHRITIAKCIGKKKALVIVYDFEQTSHKS